MTRSTRTPAAHRWTSIAPGTVLATRSIPYHILGVPTALKTTQLLYRSTSQTGKPTVNVTSVIQPLGHGDRTKVHLVPVRLRLAQSQRPAVVCDLGRPDVRRSRSERRAGGLRSVPRAGIHGDRARHRGSAGRLRRRPRVRNEHARLDPRRVQLVDRRAAERRERLRCSATPVVRSRASGPPSWRRRTRPTSTSA